MNYYGELYGYIESVLLSEREGHQGNLLVNWVHPHVIPIRQMFRALRFLVMHNTQELVVYTIE